MTILLRWFPISFPEVSLYSSNTAEITTDHGGWRSISHPFRIRRPKQIPSLAEARRSAFRHGIMGKPWGYQVKSDGKHMRNYEGKSGLKMFYGKNWDNWVFIMSYSVLIQWNWVEHTFRDPNVMIALSECSQVILFKIQTRTSACGGQSCSNRWTPLSNKSAEITSCTRQLWIKGNQSPNNPTSIGLYRLSTGRTWRNPGIWVACYVIGGAKNAKRTGGFMFEANIACTKMSAFGNKKIWLFPLLILSNSWGATHVKLTEISPPRSCCPFLINVESCLNDFL